LILDRENWPEQSWSYQQLKAWFACGAVLDFQALPSDRIILSSLVGDTDSPHYLEANPIGRLRPGLSLPPALILHGTRDGIVDFTGAKKFLAEYEALDIGPIQLHAIPGGTHLDSGRWMFDNNDERSKLMEFVARHLLD
jgi:acetyl esterase/lipase